MKVITKEQYEKSISFYDDVENQDGIGEIATWSAKKQQVTFLSDGLCETKFNLPALRFSLVVIFRNKNKLIYNNGMCYICMLVAI